MHRRLAIAFVMVLGLAVAPEASATIEGPCEATIAGQDVVARDTFARSDAISVPKSGAVPVTMTADRPIERLKLEIEFAGIRYAVREQPTTVNSSTGVVPVDEYSTYGIGLYKIVGTSTGQGFSCEAAALVDVQGNPLETAGGAIGIAMVIVGGLGVLSFALRGGRPGLASLLAMLLGVVLAIGTGLLLQQYGLFYPTRIAAILVLAGGAVLGFLAGIVGSRGYTSG
ncbi:hypothetical protein BH20ACT14_BH20ACT14_11910 [soil metagenome]|nr:hypothetical protein [Actinomycetota bacterium]MDQ3424636.1 hypothetical protein [Actinomycetota bacterium]